MSYSLLLDIHIISYTLWLVVFGVSLYMFWAIKKARGTTKEKPLMQRERKLTMMGTHTSILGIILSGGAMVSIPSGPQWGWFNFSQYAWLGTKQVIFIIILIIAFGVAMPVEKKLKKLFKEHSDDSVSDEQRAQYKKAWLFSLAVFLLVLVNTYLGLYRP